MIKEWYAAKVIMLFRFKNVNQFEYPVWENINLVRASSVEEALEKTNRFGSEEEGDDEGSLRWRKKPAEMIFSGIRKLIPLRSLNPNMTRIVHGTRISYSEFELENNSDFQKYINGEDVSVKYLKTNDPAMWHIYNHPSGIKDISVRKWEWLAPSIVMLVKFKDGIQDKYPVRENVFLTKVAPTEDAYEIAKEIGLKEEGDLDGTFTWEGRPAEWVFAGIRKILTIFTLSSQQNRLINGSEVTFSEFILDSEDAFNKLVKGEDVILDYLED